MNPSRMAAFGPIHSERAGFYGGLCLNYFLLQHNPLDPQRSANLATAERPPFSSLSSILSEFLGAQIKFPPLCVSIKCKPTPCSVGLQRAALSCKVWARDLCLRANIWFASEQVFLPQVKTTFCFTW